MEPAGISDKILRKVTLQKPAKKFQAATVSSGFFQNIFSRKSENSSKLKNQEKLTKNETF